MNQLNFRKKIQRFLIVISLFVTGSSQSFCSVQDDSWLVGVAQVDITPTDSLWLAGYASRDHSAEGTLHKIWAKALAVEDENGNRGVIITMDVLGIPKSISDNIREQCEKKYQLTKSQIILSSSHTHTGPVLRESLCHIYSFSNDQIKQIENYSDQLENYIVTLIGKAFDNMIPAQLFANNGVVRFQVNRRNNNSKTLTVQTNLNGPNDFAVPVLQVRKMNGNLLATAFGYACHPTVLNSYQWSGDYPGFAQLALEEKYPGTTALFFQGCGADQNPLPRRSVSLAHQYGQELAAAVERVILDTSNTLSSELKTGYSEIELSFSSLPSIETLEKVAADTTLFYNQNWAKEMLKKIAKGESIPNSYPYPIQIWKLGKQSIFVLGGEVVIDYAIQLKRIFGQDIFVMGYCNDVMGYIPSAQIIREGGYEGAGAQIVYGLPSTWKPNIEAEIIHNVLQLAKKVGVKIPEAKLFSNE